MSCGHLSDELVICESAAWFLSLGLEWTQCAVLSRSRSGGWKSSPGPVVGGSGTTKTRRGLLRRSRRVVTQFVLWLGAMGCRTHPELNPLSEIPYRRRHIEAASEAETCQHSALHSARLAEVRPDDWPENTLSWMGLCRTHRPITRCECTSSTAARAARNVANNNLGYCDACRSRTAAWQPRDGARQLPPASRRLRRATTDRLPACFGSNASATTASIEDDFGFKYAQDTEAQPSRIACRRDVAHPSMNHAESPMRDTHNRTFEGRRYRGPVWRTM